MTNEDIDRATYLLQNDVDFDHIADIARSVEFMASGRSCRNFTRAALINIKKFLEVIDGKKFQELASLARKTKPLPPGSRGI